MAVLNIEGVTHWSIPVNDLDEAEEFYGELLGLTPKGRLGNNTMSCFNVGDHNILLCERSDAADGSSRDDGGAHHSFTVSPETFETACREFAQREIRIDHLTYRARGFFTGRELYFFDPSGNRLELRDPSLGLRGCRSRRSRSWRGQVGPDSQGRRGTGLWSHPTLTLPFDGGGLGVTPSP